MSFQKKSNWASSLNGPITGGFAIVPDDAQPFDDHTRGLMVGKVGDVRMKLLDDSEVTLTGLLPGVIYGLRIRQVFATGTTASGLVGLV